MGGDERVEESIARQDCQLARSRREHMMEDGRSGKDEAQNGVMD